MAATKIGIVVSARNSIIRRYVHVTDDSEFVNGLCDQGEVLAFVPVGPYQSGEAWRQAVCAAVEGVTGKYPADPRCAVIDGTGAVVGIISADPEIDSMPERSLAFAYSPLVGVGCTYDPASQLFSTADGQIIPRA